nr:hypothetical protein OG409_03705 [Streptomyces sp. NBC_00974]
MTTSPGAWRTARVGSQAIAAWLLGNDRSPSGGPASSATACGVRQGRCSSTASGVGEARLLRALLGGEEDAT